MNEEQNIPPSDEVREAEKDAAGYRRFRRNLILYYAAPIALAAFAIGTLWWNATTVSDRLWWFPPAMATFWVLWGTHGTTSYRAHAYEWGFTQGTMVTMTAVGMGQRPPMVPPHISQAPTLSKHMEAMIQAAKDEREDDDE